MSRCSLFASGLARHGTENSLRDRPDFLGSVSVAILLFRTKGMVEFTHGDK